MNWFHICGGFTSVVTFISIRSRMRLLQTIQKLSLRLPQKSYQNLSRLIHAKDIFGFFFIVVQYWVYYICVQTDVIYNIVTLYIALLELQLNMLYVNCVCVLKACFKQINDSLMNLRELMTNGELYLLREPYHELKNPSLLTELKASKQQHLGLSDTIQLMETIFMQVVQEAVNLSNLEKQCYSESCIAVVTYYIIKLLLIIWACQTAKNQAMEINTTVLDVFNSISNKEIKYE
ncbi:PREDICTED: uncharacterized protein LOC105455107, partial [Wasmannia auropunctata]|uniref:uncharacterized protein LOC105455107 n=1 Tax=Wasmannia auropunctata TaxID=64793 RepID=UPI0005EDF6C3